MKPVEHPVSSLLPPRFADALRMAALARDWRRIDEIKDELARARPDLVRRRKDGSRFESVAGRSAA
ncbi:MAG: hypothetical protein KF863_21550 [Rubrivivax sp.]|nr:hypothetical protein [Rubrivivax sp.]